MKNLHVEHYEDIIMDKFSRTKQTCVQLGAHLKAKSTLGHARCILSASKTTSNTCLQCAACPNVR